MALRDRGRTVPGPAATEGIAPPGLTQGSRAHLCVQWLLQRMHPEQQARAETKLNVTGSLFSATQAFTASASAWMVCVD